MCKGQLNVLGVRMDMCPLNTEVVTPLAKSKAAAKTAGNGSVAKKELLTLSDTDGSLITFMKAVIGKAQCLKTCCVEVWSCHGLNYTYNVTNKDNPHGFSVSMLLL